MGKKILLLSNSYEVISFITERKVIKLLFNNKIDILSEWEDENITYSAGFFKLPAIVKLKNHFKRHYSGFIFSRKAIVKRDQGHCQYCWKKLTPNQITIDHIIPKAQGGQNSFINCVICCQSCNSKKGNQTPEVANMKLLRKPYHPSYLPQNYPNEVNGVWHPEWNFYLGI